MDNNKNVIRLHYMYAVKTKTIKNIDTKIVILIPK